MSEFVFLIKKIITPLFMPLPFCLLLVFVGLVLLWFTRRQRAGKAFVTTGALLLVLASYGVVTKPLLRFLERQVPPLILNAEEAARVEWIVVLSGGATSDAYVPPAARLSDSSLARVVEGVRMKRELHHAKLLLTGGRVFGSESEAEAMRAVALALGVSREDIEIETDSRDTEDQARIVRRIVGNSPLVLVTSASHMPRSLALFERAGMHPLPAPTDYRPSDEPYTSPGSFYPSAGGVRNADATIHEYLGRAWARLRGSG